MEVGFSYCYRSGQRLVENNGVFEVFDISGSRMYILGVGENVVC